MSAVDRNHKKLKLLVGAMATKTGIVGGRCERVQIDGERMVNMAFPFDKNCVLVDVLYARRCRKR